MSRGGRAGYDHYRSDNYLGEAGDHYSKNGVSLDSGSNHHGGAIRQNAGAAARSRLEALESERKNLALLKGNGQNGSYGAGGPGSRGSYDRAIEHRNYHQNNMTPA